MTTITTRSSTPSPMVSPGKNGETILAITCLIEDEESVADLTETLLFAERGETYRDAHALTYARLLRLVQYVEHADMAAGVRHRLRQTPLCSNPQRIIYPTLLHELENSRIWKVFLLKEEQRKQDGQKRKGGLL